MAAAFLDTSALLRRYDRSEPGAARVRQFCVPSRGHDLLLARITSVEIASAIGRKVREGTWSVSEGNRAWKLFRVHWRDQYQVAALTDQVYAEAERLLFQYALRAFDAVHVASALLLAPRVPQGALQFWTADRRQAAAARSAGLMVELVS
ncbi:MAG: type II toxin-antitoxin system VapC family toxin [Chloroflexota bacterium]